MCDEIEYELAEEYLAKLTLKKSKEKETEKQIL